MSHVWHIVGQICLTVALALVAYLWVYDKCLQIQLHRRQVKNLKPKPGTVIWISGTKEPRP